MTVVVPSPVPLDMPPGDADALSDVVSDVAWAGFHLTVLSRRLAGPAAAAPGWLGADAAAAAAQVGVVATLAEDVVAAVLAAISRLGDHADRLHEARRQVAALRREQEYGFSGMWTRLGMLGDPHLVMTTDMPEAVAVVEELRAAEDTRRRRHAAILEDVAADAAATARVLIDSCAAAGGRATPEDAGRLVMYLATRLPGWGDEELAARGRALAYELMGGPVDPAGLDAAAEAAVALASSPEFATALLADLGVDGFRTLLDALGSDVFGGSSAVARVLAAALGAATPGREGHDPVADVLAATYVRPGNFSEGSDVVAAGMAAILVAAAPGTRGGLRLETVVAWGRQLLRREGSRGEIAGAGAVPRDWDPRTYDPAALVVDVLVRRGESTHAAALLSDRETWDVLLARGWSSPEDSIGALVDLAGAQPGPAGGIALRAGLEALGAGLADGGDPDGWTVVAPTAAAVARPLAAGLAQHPAVVVGLLEAGVTGEPGAPVADALRGLGHLSIDRTAAVVVEKALHDWTAARPSLDGTDLPAVVLPAGYLAVREYGQRLAYALEAYGLQQEAEIRQFWWKLGPLHLLSLMRGGVGQVAGVVEPFAARYLDMDGSWEIGPDRGQVLDSDDAVRAALTHALDAEGAVEVLSAAGQARAAYEGVAETLGELDPPEEPETHWWDPVFDAALNVGLDRAKNPLTDPLDDVVKNALEDGLKRWARGK